MSEITKTHNLDICFGDYVFQYHKFTLDDKTEDYAWFLYTKDHIVLEGNYGPFFTRNEVFIALPLIEKRISKIKHLRELEEEIKIKEEDIEDEKNAIEDDVKDMFKNIIGNVAENLANPPQNVPQNVPPNMAPIINMLNAFRNI